MLIFAGWVNRSQLEVIAYLKEENRVLHEQLGNKRLLFTDAPRRRLAAKAKLLGRRGLVEEDTLVTPGTLAAMVPDADRAEVRRQCRA